jgi:hypothetical protein
MEVGENSGWIAARRCLEALAETQDVRTRAALWRAAKRYAGKARMERGADDGSSPLPHALDGGARIACD